MWSALEEFLVFSVKSLNEPLIRPNAENSEKGGFYYFFRFSFSRFCVQFSLRSFFYWLKVLAIGLPCILYTLAAIVGEYQL